MNKSKKYIKQGFSVETTAFRLSKSLAEFAAYAANKVPIYFRPRRVRGRKYVSGCKCGICLLQAGKLCAQQTAKNWRKSPKGFFDKLKRHGLTVPLK